MYLHLIVIVGKYLPKRKSEGFILSIRKLFRLINVLKNMFIETIQANTIQASTASTETLSPTCNAKNVLVMLHIIN